MLCSFIVSTWVVVTNIVHPGHFYVQYLAEAGENVTLSKKISCFCSKESSFFTSKDIVETGACFFYLTFWSFHHKRNSKEKCRDFRCLKCSFKNLHTVSYYILYVLICATSNNLSTVLFRNTSHATSPCRDVISTVILFDLTIASLFQAQ